MTRNLQTRNSSVVDGCNQPDYDAVELPAKSPTEYSYVERRAELLQQIRDLGHPALINQTEQAERYDVSQQQISKDLNRLAEHVDETLGERRALVTDAVFNRAIQGLLEEGEYRKAARTVKEWDEWITERKDIEELNEKLDRIQQRQERQR